MTMNYSVDVQGAGARLKGVVQRSGDSASEVHPTIPHGYAGTLTTRTDDDTGTITLAAGHGITTGMNVDIYWSTGVQYDVTVGTVSTNSMPFDLGVGDNLPIETTAVVVCQRVIIDPAAINGDELAMLAIGAEFDVDETARCHAHFIDNADATVAAIKLPANLPLVYDITGGATNPFTGNPIVGAYFSNGSATNDATIKVIWDQDVTN